MVRNICGRINSALSACSKAMISLVCAFIIVGVLPMQFVKAVSIYDGDDVCKVYTFENDADAILEEKSIERDSNDRVKVLNNGGDAMTILIERAFPVYVSIGEITATYDVTGGTVRELLNSIGCTPSEFDEINYSLDDTVFDGMNIKITQVRYETESTYKTLKHKVTQKVDLSLKPGEQKVLREGKDGSVKINTVKKYVNGKLTQVGSERIVEQKAVKEVVSVGIKKYASNPANWKSDLKPKKPIILDKNGVPVKYKSKMTGVASAYCCGTTCSTGVHVKQGYIAVDPNIIPYGTEMYIRTPDNSYIYGYAVAADTGGFTAWGNTIADLYLSSYDACVQFGRRPIEIYFI